MTLDTARTTADSIADHLSDHNTLHAKANRVFDVEADYGAVGDGTTDDTTAVQNAIDAAEAAGGGDVLFPVGTYASSGLTIHDDNVRLIGTGRQSLIKHNGSSGHLIDIAGTSDTPIDGVAVHNLRIQGYGDDSGSTQDHGIRLNYANRAIISNVWASDATFSAIHIQNSLEALVHGIHIEQGSLGDNGGWYGISANNASLADKYAGHVIFGVVGWGPEHIVSLVNVDHVVTTNVTARGIANDYAINYTTVTNGVISNFSFEDCDGGVFLEQTCDSVIVANGTMVLTGDAEHGVKVTAATNTVIENLTIDMSGASTAGHGIQFDGDSDGSTAQNVIITSPPQKGILVDNGCQYVTINGCTVDDAGDSSRGAIDVGTGEYAKIVNNTVKASAGIGIYCASKYFTLNSNVAIGNGNDGIQLAFADDGLVGMNVSRGNTGYGLSVENSNSERNLVIANQLTGNTEGSYQDNGTDTVSVSNQT